MRSFVERPPHKENPHDAVRVILGCMSRSATTGYCTTAVSTAAVADVFLTVEHDVRPSTATTIINNIFFIAKNFSG